MCPLHGQTVSQGNNTTGGGFAMGDALAGSSQVEICLSHISAEQLSGSELNTKNKAHLKHGERWTDIFLCLFSNLLYLRT